MSKESRSATNKRNRNRGKSLEKYCARFYHGRRVGILNYEDVQLAQFSCEAKERERLPASIKKWMSQVEGNASGYGKIAFLHLHELFTNHKDDLVVLRASDFVEFVQMKEGE